MYNTKYRANFDDVNENDIIINLKKKDYTGNVANLSTSNNPLTIRVLNSDIFDTVKTSGVTIELISEFDRQLIDLYTANYKEWQIEVLKNNSVIYSGYISPELYSESFAESFNYIVSIEGNNGIGILSREKYIKSDNTNYRGVTSVFQVIKNCIEKIGINYAGYKIVTNLKVNNYNPISNNSLIQHLTVNNDNYIDEDGVVMNCYNVLDAVLKPLNLSLFIEDNYVYIVDFEYLKNENVDVKTFSFSSDTCFNSIENITLDLNSVQQINSNLVIEAGVNNYVININRYVKNIIELVDFNEDYSGDEYENVWVLNNKNIFNVNGNTNQKFWISEVDSFKNYSVDNNTTNTYLTSYYTTNTNNIAFCGSVKPQKVVDDILINYESDDVTFDKYIIINNPFRSWGNSYKLPSNDLWRRVYDPFDAEQDVFNIAKKVFNYTIKSPIIYNSNESLIRLHFNVKFLTAGIMTALGNLGGPFWKDISTIEKTYGNFHYWTKILFKDENGNIKYFLRMKGSENFNSNTIFTSKVKYEFELVEYLGQTFTFCFIPISNLNEAKNEVPILNEDFEVKFDIPVSFDDYHHLEIEFYNIFYRVTDNYYGINFTEQGYQHYTPIKAMGDFKETIPHLAINNVYTSLINKKTNEEIDLNDEELHFFLDDKYQTKEIKDEFLNYNSNSKYITDVGGITLNYQFINDVNSFSTFEDYKANKMINQYKNNNINLSFDLKTDKAKLFKLYKLNSDSIWNNKKWVADSIDYYVDKNEINLKLKELF